MIRLALIPALLTLTLSSPALAWDLRTDSEGDVVRWTKPVKLVLEVGAGDSLKERDAAEAIAAAVAHLDQSTPYLDVSLTVGEAKPLGYSMSGDNQNSILVLEDWPYAEGTLAVTLVTLNARTNELLDADIAFNAEDHDFKVMSEGALRNDEHHFDDVQNTVTHELGHVLGLMHSKTAEDLVMYPSAPPGELTKRQLKQDDVDGLLSLYGTAPAGAVTPGTSLSPEPAVGCSSTSGSASPVSAVLVLAALALLRARRPARLAVVAALVALPTVALAQDARPRVQVRQDLARAEQVTVVEITARRSMRHPSQPGLIVTELTVQPVECLKGPCAPPRTLVVAGGRVGELEQVAIHEPVPAVGDQMLTVKTAGRTRLLWAREDERRELLRTLRLQQPRPAALAPATP